MRIEKVRIENFRLLENFEMTLEPTATVIVGRNNSGKTSLAEIFGRLTSDQAAMFRLEDFSAGTRSRFLDAKARFDAGETHESVRDALPAITVTLTLRYAADSPNLGPLSDFIIDLDPDCTQAIARVAYRPSLANISALFDMPVLDGEHPEEARIAHFFRGLRDNIAKAYEVRLTAVDPTDETNERMLERKALTKLIQCGFIAAQRTLDAGKSGETNVLGKLLEVLFATASAENATPEDQGTAARLKSAVDALQVQIQSSVNQQFEELLPTFDNFGYPGLSDPQLRTETVLEVESLLSEYTRVFYTGSHGVHLPEGYNGLGTRNLIYILLQLTAFYKAYQSRSVLPGVHVVFIEEPEAHLHPQMQEVFIKQLENIVVIFADQYPQAARWEVQFMVSTHSSHLANEASFDSIRYFLTRPNAAGPARHTVVKDFRRGLDAIAEPDRTFLHKYMTLTKCDLYFADKCILIEGPSERILMPRICRLVDEQIEDANRLSRQYVSVIEVGGAYAHRFYPLLDFLEIKSLIITDVDAVRQNAQGRWEKCRYAIGTRTSNAAIKDWFGNHEITAEELRQKEPLQKIAGYRRIAYQIPEPGLAACARSFEDALVLANPGHFGLQEGEDWEEAAWNKAQDMPKTETALAFALEIEAWNVPRYLSEGLTWLADGAAQVQSAGEQPAAPPEAPATVGAISEHA